MYGRLAQHGQSFDYTRRYQNDIVVYSENGLRAAMGNLKRGTRVVIANDIYVTKTINVNIQSESLLKTTNVDRREVIIAGFGGGSLRVKDNVSADFPLFSFGASEQSGITFSNLYVEGFKGFIQCAPSLGAIYHADLTIENCYMESVQEVFRMSASGAVFFTRANIHGNRFISCDFYRPTFSAITFLYSSFNGNTFTQVLGSAFVLNTCTFTSNGISQPAVEFYGLNSVLDSNSLRNVSFDPAASKFILTNNKFITGTPSLSNVQGFVSRNNVDTGTDRDILAPGRISIAGELIGQTVIDGVTNTFACTTSSTTYKQLNDDTDATKKPYISFYVPANRKITIRLRCPVEDLDTHRDFFFIRLTDVDDETSPASFAAFFNDEHEFQLRDDSRIPFVFEWYIDGTDPGINWTAGDLKTFWFQVKVSDTSDTVSFEGGNSIGPIMVSANGVSDDLNFVDMG